MIVFCLVVDAKTLMMTIPLVSGSRELAHGAGVGGGVGVGLALARSHAGVWRVTAAESGGALCKCRCSFAMLTMVPPQWVGAVWWPRAGVQGVAASLLGADGTGPA